MKNDGWNRGNASGYRPSEECLPLGEGGTGLKPVTDEGAKPSPWGEGGSPSGLTDVGSIVFLSASGSRTGSPPHPSRLAPCHPLQQERAFSRILLLCVGRGVLQIQAVPNILAHVRKSPIHVLVRVAHHGYPPLLQVSIPLCVFLSAKIFIVLGTV